MRIKKYKVNSLPDALKRIKQDLGQEAIILNTKNVRTGGFLGLFKKKQIEVVAAIGSAVPVQKDQATEVKVPIPDIHTSISEQNESTINGYQQVSHAHEHHSPQNELLGEIQYMKKFMMNMMTEKDEQLPVPVQKINERLIKQGVMEDIRAEILGNIMKNLDHQLPLNEHEIQKNAYENLLSFIKTLPVQKEETQAKMICFVGPTGVGKTTTIAKLAADYLLKHQISVGFITADTYRIAAVDQLRTYANILNIPLEIVYSPDELASAYEKLSACDLILMDTPGRNYLEKQYIDETKHLLPQDKDLITHLVLSMTSKYEDLKKIIENFEDVEIHRLTLTKTDETYSYGMILNLLREFPIPLTYFTNGQNVPDDLITATPELIAKYIWGEDVNERSS